MKVGSSWSLSVRASVLLRQYSLSLADVEEADEKLLEFCKAFEECYGKECCTPNMHLHAHIKDSVLDFGPISAFWAFPFNDLMVYQNYFESRLFLTM